MKIMMTVLGVAVSMLSACGGEDPTPPTLTRFEMTTSPIVRGQQANGLVAVRDPDGLGGLKFRVALSGPASASFDILAQGVADTATEATLGFVFLLTETAPAGAYTVGLTAIDQDELESNTLTDEVRAE